MKHVLIYCRSGFEKECAGEIQDKANDLELFGFPRVKKQTGYVVLNVTKRVMLIRSLNKLTLKR